MPRSKKLCATLIVLTFAITGCQAKPTTKVKINQTTYQAELAKTEAEIQKGLMYRTNLKQDQAMLFKFDTSQPRSFWMKNTLIPLDIIHIDEQKKIVHITHNAQPCKLTDPEQENCPTYNSPTSSKYVLEVNANQAIENDFNLGDLVNF
jgi:uncharacterized membrane protein (UPF0127 family)